jgi:adenosylmethionine-8-amino-7-oxononanoate aminotransferase
MACLDIVTDRAGKAPANEALMGRITSGAAAAGVLVRASGSNINLSPPLVAEAADIDAILEALDASLAKC